MMHDRAARRLPDYVVASDAAPCRNLLFVTSPPGPSGAGVACHLREVTRQRGRFPLKEMRGIFGESVSLRAWSELSRLRSETDIAEVVIAYPAQPAVLRQLAALAHTNGFGLSLVPSHPGTRGELLPTNGTPFAYTVLPVSANALNKPQSRAALPYADHALWTLLVHWCWQPSRCRWCSLPALPSRWIRLGRSYSHKHA